MPIETLYADAHLGGAFLNPGNAIGNTPGTWAGELNANTNYTSRWSMADPVNPLTPGATHAINVRCRKGTNSGNPTVNINLWQAGVLVASTGAQTITSTTGQVLSTTFTTAEMVPGAGVEIEVVQTSVGGNPSTRNCAQIAYIEWEANTTSDVSGGTTSETDVANAGSTTGGAVLTVSQPNWRIRSDDSQVLNADAGWAAALNTSATLLAERRFRLRIEVETNLATTITPKLQFRRNGGAWTDLAPYIAGTTTTIARAALVVSDQYVDNDATTNVLSGSAETFTAGSGQEDNTVPGVTLTGAGHTEFEFCLLVRKLVTGPDENLDGDTFDFRLVHSTGDAFDSYPTLPSVTLDTANTMGGTYPESPGRIGPFIDTNGNMYFVIEATENQAAMAAMKSVDQGVHWNIVDNANRPASVDAEGFSVVQDGTTLYMVHHNSNDNIVLHAFNTSDDATAADQWAIKDESITAAVTRLEQICAVERRSDSTTVAFYPNSTNKIFYKIRSAGGVWGAQTSLDAEAVNFYSVFTVMGANDLIHIFYADSSSGILYHRTLSSSDVLSARQSLATGLGTSSVYRQPMSPAVVYDDAGVEVVSILYVTSAAALRSVQLRDGTPQATQLVDTGPIDVDDIQSRQPNADVVADGTTLIAALSPTSDNLLYYRTSEDGGAWTDRVLLDGSVNLDAVRGQVLESGATRFYAMYVETRPAYHPSLSGHTGGGRYVELVLTEGVGVPGATASETDTANAGSVSGPPEEGLGFTEFYAFLDTDNEPNPVVDVTNVSWEAGDRLFVFTHGKDDAATIGGITAPGLSFSQVYMHHDVQGQIYIALWQSDLAAGSGSGTVSVSALEDTHSGGIQVSVLVVSGDGPTLHSRNEADTGAVDTDSPSVDVLTTVASTLLFFSFNTRHRTFTVDPNDNLIPIRENSQAGIGGSRSGMSLYHRDASTATTYNGSGTLLTGAFDWIAVGFSVEEAGGPPDVSVNGSQALESNTANAGSPALSVGCFLVDENGLVLVSEQGEFLQCSGPGAVEADAANAGAVAVGIVVSGAQAAEADNANAGAVETDLPVVGNVAIETTTASTGSIVHRARPITDITNPGAWTTDTGATTNIHTAIDEVEPNDNDHIRGVVNPDTTFAGNTVDFELSDMFDPGTDAGHIFRYRYRKDQSGGQQITIRAELYRQSTSGQFLEQDHVDVSDVVAQGEIVLSAAQAAAIDDYTDLKIRFGAIGSIAVVGQRRGIVTWAEFEVPMVQDLPDSVNGGTAAETDTANPGQHTVGAIVAGAQASETDTALAGQVVVAATVAGQQAIESDAAQAGQVSMALLVSGSTAAESDAANAGQFTVGAVVAGVQAAETDVAQTGQAAVVVTGQSVSESDVAQAGQSSVGALVAGAQALESDTANAGQPTTAAAVAGQQADETDSAQVGAIFVAVTVAGAQALEADAANPGVVVLSSSGGQATESDTATAGTTTVVALLAGAQAQEADVPLSGAVSTTGSTAGKTAHEIDTGQAGQAALTRPGEQAVESDVSLAGTIGRGLAGMQAAETDVPNDGQAALAVFGAQASESNAALAGVVSMSSDGQQGAESDDAGAGQSFIATNVAGATGVESDEALAGSVSTAGATDGQTALEFDVALAGQVAIDAPGAVSSETDVANAGSVTETSGDLPVAGSQATEVDQGQPGQVSLMSQGGFVFESDTAQPGAFELLQIGLQALELDQAGAGTVALAWAGGRGLELDQGLGGSTQGPFAPAPEHRTLRVVAENRTLVVSAEDRVLVIERESRQSEVTQ